MATKKADEVEAVDQSTGEIMDIKALNKLFGVEENFVPESYQELDDYFAEQGGIIEFRGSAYDVIKKDELVGKPFVIVDVRFYEGKFGEACAVLAIDEDDRCVVFNDGSTGVFNQVKHMVNTAKRKGGFRCPKGLRFSEYTYTPVDFTTNPIGDEVPAKTFYVA